MLRWTDRPTVTDPNALADADTVLMADMSRAVGDRDVQVPLQTLRTFLGAGITVGADQPAHGFSVGHVIRHNGTAYVRATADTAGNAEAVGVVVAAPDANTFAYQTAGVVSTLSGLTPGELYYLQNSGSLGTSPGTVEKPILIATTATTAVLILAINGESGGGGDSGSAYYDLQLGFTNQPASGAVDLLLVPRAVVIDDADPGEVFVGMNPTDGTAVVDVQVNGVSVGSLSVTSSGTVSWALVSDIVLAIGDRLSLVAPSPADSTLADLIVAFRGTAA